MVNKKQAITISCAILIGVILFSAYIPNPKPAAPLASDTETAPDVTISTDKNGYDKGEIVNITVDNRADRPIFYYGDNKRFWGIEYFKDGKWINPFYESGGGFQLTEEEVGGACQIALYERSPPSEFGSNSRITEQWNQRICPMEPRDPFQPRIVRYIESRTYRLLFDYGLGASGKDPYALSDNRTAYSNNFTIK